MSVTLDGNWIPPSLEEIHIETIRDEYLVINPRVPSWFVTNSIGLLLLACVDGCRNVNQISSVFSSLHDGASPDEVQSYFKTTLDIGFFDRPDEIPRELVDKNQWLLRRLSGIYLHLTNKCNLQCVYCYRESSPFIPTKRSADDICGALGRLRQFTHEKCELTFSGGEPLVHEGFRQISKYAKALGYENRLLTNGILVDEKLADFIAEHFERVQISLDSPNEIEHSEFRGGNYGKVVGAIKLLAERSDNVTVQVTVGKRNQRTATSINEVLPNNVRVRFTPVLPMGRGRTKSTEFISNQEFVKLNTVVTGGKHSLNLKPGQASRSCWAGRGSISISDVGDAYPCHLFHYDEYKLGNVYEDDLRTILFSDDLLNYARSMDVEKNNEDCRKCPIRLVCGGGCKANTLHGTGTMFGVDIHCSFLKAVTFRDMYLESSNGNKVPPNLL